MQARLLTTGVGSLPFHDAARALDHVFKNYSLPFLPELPSLQPNTANIPPMLARVCSPRLLQALATKQTKPFFADAERWAASAAEAQETLEHWTNFPGFAQRAPGSERLKLQLVGPETFATFLQTLCGQSRETARAFAWTWIQTLSQALIARLTPLMDTHIYLFWDEPALDGSEQLADRYWQARLALPSKRCAFGIHSCASQPLAVLSAQSPRLILGFDTHANPEERTSMVLAARKHLDGGGGLALGLVDTRTDHINIEATITRGRGLLSQLAPNPNFTEILLTGSCGTGLKTEVFEEILAETLKTIGALSLAL